MRDQQDWTGWSNEVNFFKIGSRISKIGLTAEFQNRLEIITASLSLFSSGKISTCGNSFGPIALKHFHKNIFLSWNIFYWLAAAAREKETFQRLEMVVGTLISGRAITLLTRSDMGARHGSPWCRLPIRSAILTPLYQTAGPVGRVQLCFYEPSQTCITIRGELRSLLGSDQDEGCSYGGGGDIEEINIGTTHHTRNWKHR